MTPYIRPKNKKKKNKSKQNLKKIKAQKRDPIKAQHPKIGLNVQILKGQCDSNFKSPLTVTTFSPIHECLSYS